MIDLARRVGIRAALVLGLLTACSPKPSTAVLDAGAPLAAPRFAASTAGASVITLSGPVSLVLKREGATWSVADPAHPGVARPAEDAQVTTFLSFVDELSSAAPATVGAADLAKLELDTAQGLELLVSSATGPLLHVVFGKASDTGAIYFRDEATSSVFLTTSPAARMARRDPREWRRRAFFPAKASEVVHLDVTLGDGSAYAIDRASGDWALTAPSPLPTRFRFDRSAADRLVAALTGVLAQSFGGALSDAETGLATPAAVLRAQRADGSSATLRLGHRTTWLPARLDGDAEVYLLPPYQADTLVKHLSDLRDLTLLPFQAETVTGVTLHSSGKTTALAKTAAGWSVVQPNTVPSGFELDGHSVDKFLGWLGNLRASRLAEGVSVTAAGLAKPAVSLELAEGKSRIRLEFGTTVPGSSTGEVFARSSGDGAIAVVPTADRGALERGLDLFRKSVRVGAPPPLSK